MAYSRKRTGSRTYSRRPSKTTYRKASKRKAAPRQQTMKIVVEVAPQNSVSRPDISHMSLVEKPKGKAKL